MIAPTACPEEEKEVCASVETFKILISCSHVLVTESNKNGKGPFSCIFLWMCVYACMFKKSKKKKTELFNTIIEIVIQD